MGAVLNTAGAAEIAAELACCACSSVCGFICKDPATRAKLRYCTLLFFATIMCFVMLVPGMRRNIDRVPHLCGKVVTSETCDKLFGFGAVYRVMLSMTSFYGIFALWTIRITRADSFRAKFNNGFWIVKLILLGGITAGTFFIPRKSEFFRIWMYACLVGAFVFMLYQIIIVVDFGHSWSVTWAEKLETSNSKLWYLAMVLATLLMFMISFAAITTFYVFFAGSRALTQCKANMFYMTFVVIQCFLATVISVIPTVQQELAGAGLLQSSVVILYTVYLTFNTLSTEPDATCNPLGKVILDYDKMSGINGEALFGCLLTFALIIFACTVRAHTSHLGKYGLALSESEDYALATLLKQQEKTANDKEKSEINLDDFVGYNYSLFHIIMALASLHLLMILTNWHSPDQRSNMKRLVKNWASVWVQMASSFICILIYIWFLVTPLIRKIWGPLFGIPVTDDGRHGFAGQRSDLTVAKASVAKASVAKASLAKANVAKTNIAKAVLMREEKSGEVITESGDQKGDMTKIDADLSKGSIRRFKSVESLRSAVSSITKRKSRVKSINEKNDSQILENSIDKSKDIIINENEQGIGGKRNGTGGRRKGLIRFGSIESLKSGFSAISNATNEVKRKLRTKLKRRKKEEKIGNENQEQRCEEMKREDGNAKERAEIGIYRSEHSFMKVQKKGRGERTIGDYSGHSDHSIGLNAKDNCNGGQRNDSLNRSFNLKANKASSKAEYMDNRRTVANKKGTFDRHCDEECEGTSQASIEMVTGKREQGVVVFEKGDDCERAAMQQHERPKSSASEYGSSTFKEKAQDPEVARELLRLQWKILRMQAKVVKIQEKIMRIQAEDEAAKKNAIEAVERLEPPIGQSSTVAGGVYSKRQEMIYEIKRKEHG